MKLTLLFTFLLAAIHMLAQIPTRESLNIRGQVKTVETVFYETNINDLGRVPVQRNKTKIDSFNEKGVMTETLEIWDDNDTAFQTIFIPLNKKAFRVISIFRGDSDTVEVSFTTKGNQVLKSYKTDTSIVSGRSIFDEGKLSRAERTDENQQILYNVENSYNSQGYLEEVSYTYFNGDTRREEWEQIRFKTDSNWDIAHFKEYYNEEGPDTWSGHDGVELVQRKFSYYGKSPIAPPKPEQETTEGMYSLLKEIAITRDESKIKAVVHPNPDIREEFDSEFLKNPDPFWTALNEMESIGIPIIIDDNDMKYALIPVWSPSLNKRKIMALMLIADQGKWYLVGLTNF